jgi:predicted lipid-binding transport protein (Tim44 family)
MGCFVDFVKISSSEIFMAKRRADVIKVFITFSSQASDVGRAEKGDP